MEQERFCDELNQTSNFTFVIIIFIRIINIIVGYKASDYINII